MLYPVLSLAFFATMQFHRAIIMTVVVGYLVLPEGVSFAMSPLPAIQKFWVIGLGLILGWLFYRPRDQVNGSRRRLNLMSIILYMSLVSFVVAPIMTTFTNLEPLIFDDATRPGLTINDAVVVLRGTVILIPPLIFARAYLNDETSRRDLLVIVAIAGLIYTLPTLYELRMSPQINRMIYGFFPHEWQQHTRNGGFRPVVFLRHGLWLGFFLLMAALSAFTLARIKDPPIMPRWGWLFAGLWIFAVLAVSKNTGALFIGIAFAPLILFTGSWVQVRVAMLVAVVFLSYPALRQADLIPVDVFQSALETRMPNRAQSLGTRLRNETALLEHVEERMLFGWGGWGRARVRDENGRDLTTLDGLWIIVLSEQGWVGYIGFFGLVAGPLLLVRRSMRRREDFSPSVAGMSIILAANLIYIVPNSALSPIGWTIIGSLIAFCEVPRLKRSGAPERVHRYTRFSSPDDLMPHSRQQPRRGTKRPVDLA